MIPFETLQFFQEFCKSNPGYEVSRKNLLDQIKAAATIAEYLPSLPPQHPEANPNTGSGRITIKLPNLFGPVQKVDGGKTARKKKRKRKQPVAKSQDNENDRDKEREDSKKRKVACTSESNQSSSTSSSRDQTSIAASKESLSKSTRSDRDTSSNDQPTSVSTSNTSQNSTISLSIEGSKSRRKSSESGVLPSVGDCSDVHDLTADKSVVRADACNDTAAKEPESILETSDDASTSKMNPEPSILASSEKADFIPGLSFINSPRDAPTAFPEQDVHQSAISKDRVTSPCSNSSSDKSCEDVFALADLAQPPLLDDLGSAGAFDAPDCTDNDPSPLKGVVAATGDDGKSSGSRSKRPVDNIFELNLSEDDEKSTPSLLADERNRFLCPGRNRSVSGASLSLGLSHSSVCLTATDDGNAEQNDSAKFSLDLSKKENQSQQNRIHENPNLNATEKNPTGEKKATEDYRNLRPFVRLPIVPKLPKLASEETSPRASVGVPINAILARRTEKPLSRTDAMTYDLLPVSREQPTLRSSRKPARRQTGLSEFLSYFDKDFS